MAREVRLRRRKLVAALVAIVAVMGLTGIASVGPTSASVTRSTRPNHKHTTPPPTSSTTSTTTSPTSSTTSTTSTTTSSTTTSSTTTTTTDPVPSTTTTTTDPVPTTSTTTTTPPPGWTLVWSDEFDGTAVDTTKWNVRDGDYLSYDLACIYKSNVSVSNGVLDIQSRKESAPCNGGRGYTTGYLDTKGLGAFDHGRFEIRAKMALPKNHSKGLWPAFWLRPDDGADGELDVLEQYGTGLDGSGGDGHEFGETHATVWKSYSPSVHEGNDYQTGVDTSADFHTYAMEWKPGQIQFFFDGVLNYTRDTSTTSWLSSVYDVGRTFNLRLNQQVGGSWAGNPDSGTTFPSDYLVDYVRIYK